MGFAIFLFSLLFGCDSTNPIDNNHDADTFEDADTDVDIPLADHGECEIVEDPLDDPALRNRPDQTDYLIIAADQLAEPAQTHAQYRDDNGFRSEVLTLSQALDDGHGGIETDLGSALLMLRQAISERRQNLDDGRTLYVLLLGDSSQPWSADTSEIPADEIGGWLWDEANPTTSDNTIADLNGDHLPDVAIGRIPAQTASQAEAILSRTRDVEAEYNIGSWNYRVNLFASEAGFGEFIDSMIEEIGFDAVRDIPNDWSINFTYARPGSDYAYPPGPFSDHVYELLNFGSVMTVYMGHGSTGDFDDVTWELEREPILDLSDLSDLDMSSNRSPFLPLIACLNGAFDTGESLAEKFLNEQGGPVSLLAATELSHPFANTILIRELAVVFLIHRYETVGEAVLEAKRRMITAQDEPIRQELIAYASLDESMDTLEEQQSMIEGHNHIYVLFGDPARRLDYPQGTVTIELESEEVIAEQEQISACFQVQGRPEGQVTVTVNVDRDDVFYDLEDWEMYDSNRDSVVMSNNELANRKWVHFWEGRYEGGGFHLSFPTTEEHRGRLNIRAYVYGGGQDAIGSTELRVLRNQQ